MAECDAVCEHAHLPLQSGSTRILKAMRRTYGRERYLRLVDELRAAIPDLALTTDIIVGFPGETERDFEETLEVVEEVGYDGAFTFVYSPRQGTEAATMPDQVPEESKRERIERLVELVQRVAHERNQERVGRVEEVLVEGPSRTDHLAARPHPPQRDRQLRGGERPGDLVDVRIEARPRRLSRAPSWPQRCSVVATSSGTGLLNVRDLGGHPTEDGARRGSARSSAPTASASSATRAGEALVDYGMKTVVDLRANQELEADPPAELPVEVRHVPLFDRPERLVFMKARWSSTSP